MKKRQKDPEVVLPEPDSGMERGRGGPEVLKI